MDMPGRTEVDQSTGTCTTCVEVRYMKRDMATLRTELKKARAAAEHAAEPPAAPPAPPVPPKPKAEDASTAGKSKAARKKKVAPGETPKTGRREG